jgi:hypothetical protein
MGPVFRLRISFDEQFLFSASEDGCLCIFKIVDRELKAAKRDKETTYSDEVYLVIYFLWQEQVNSVIPQVLVTKTEMLNKFQQMSKLKSQVEELRLENEYELRTRDLQYEEKIKEVQEKFAQEVSLLKRGTGELKEERKRNDAHYRKDLEYQVSRNKDEIKVKWA